jgi:hypothetical protein
MSYALASRRRISPSAAIVLSLLCFVGTAGMSMAGTVIIGDQSRGVQWKFAGDTPFGSSNSQSSPVPEPFDTTVDERDTGEGGASARVAATFNSVLGADVSSAGGELRVERAGRPAAANAAFIFEFGVNGGPVEVAIDLDATYQRLSGDADPSAVTGQLRVVRIPVGTPPGTPGQVMLSHEFALGAADDQTESFHRGGNDGSNGDALLLDPGPYGLVFHIGLPEGPPNFENWNVDGTSTDRADRVSFNVAARFTSADGGGGPPTVPLPPAALSGGTLLAALAGVERLRARLRRR